MAQQNVDTDNESLDSTMHVDERSKLSRKEYEEALRDLQTELCSVQDWVKQTGQRIVLCSKAATPPAKAEPSAR
jgi:polyphosphate kinase 2 (PPK2 family)